MTLFFANGDSFATGAIRYVYRPATESETTNRIILKLQVADAEIDAILDTGAPYPILAPRLARQAGLDRLPPLERKIMLIRGMRLDGSIIRVNMTLPADEGEDLDVDATVFIPDVEEYWGDFPSFIGQIGFLERMRFAVDPSTDTFYFGTLS